MSLTLDLPTLDKFQDFLNAPGTTRESVIDAANTVAKGLFLDFNTHEVRTTALLSFNSLMVFTWGVLDMMKVDRDILAKMMEVDQQTDYNFGRLMTGSQNSYENQVMDFFYPTNFRRGWDLDTSDIGYKVDIRKEAGLVDGRQKNPYYALTIPKKAFQEFAADPSIEISIRLELNRLFRRAGDSEFVVKLEKGSKAPDATEKELREVLVEVIRDSLGARLKRSKVNLSLRSQRMHDKISHEELEDLVNKAMNDILNG